LAKLIAQAPVPVPTSSTRFVSPAQAVLRAPFADEYFPSFKSGGQEFNSLTRMRFSLNAVLDNGCFTPLQADLEDILKSAMF